jgi:asparagine synthase (glutamine-hydrolysing)
METLEELKRRMLDAVRSVVADDLGVAFSGGVDSSLLAKLCKDEGKKVTALTVGFENLQDIKTSEEVAKALGLISLHEVVPFESLEEGIKRVLKVIQFDRIARLENCVCFYFVFRLASNNRINTVLSANGLDELFCGYDIYRCSDGENAIKDLMKNLVKTAYDDKEEIDKVSGLFGVKYICPFLFKEFVDYAMDLPLNLKIKNRNDLVRKHILRQAAQELGVPGSAAMRAKKAFQYSSGLHKAIRKLAKIRGFTKRVAKASGFRSEMEAYIEALKT